MPLYTPDPFVDYNTTPLSADGLNTRFGAVATAINTLDTVSPARVDLWKAGVRATASATSNRDTILNSLAAVPTGVGADLVLPGDIIPIAPLTIPDRTRVVTGRDASVGGVLRGDGLNGTILKLADGSNADLLTIAGAYWTITDLGLDGNKENNTAGSCLRISKPRVTVRNTSIGWGFEHGIVNEGASTSDKAHAPLLSDIYVRGCGGIGVYVKGINAPDTQATNIWVGTCGSHGIKVEAVAGIWTNIHVWGNGGDGFASDGAGAHTTIAGIYSETNTGSGIRFSTGSNGNKVVGFWLWKNSTHGIFLENISGKARITIADGEMQDMTGYGIVGQNSSYVTVKGIHSHDDQTTKTQGYAIQTNGSSDFWTITDNIMLASDHRLTSKSLVGTNNYLRGNKEFTSASGGVAPGTITVGASPYAYQNTSGTREDVYVQGGTVSLVERSRTGAWAGEQVNTGLTAGQVTLDNQDYVRVTYSVAPTMKKIAERA